MNRSRSNTFFLAAVAALALSSATPTEAVTVSSVVNKPVAITLIATIVSFVLYYKSVKPMMVSEDDSFIEDIKNARTLRDLKQIVKRWVIGYWGKSGKIKLKTDGATKFAHDLVFKIEDEIPAYGLCGVVWSHLKDMHEQLKMFKDLRDVAKFYESFD